MASLGGLVAGVAHEINTPIGISITSASTMHEELRALQDNFSSGNLKRTELEEFISHARQACNILHTNLQRASNLVSSFKRVAVDQTLDEWRTINLRDYCDEILISLGPRYKHRPITVHNNCNKDIEFCTNPGAIYQVISNLVLNSLTHAYDADNEGHISIIASRDQDRIHIDYHDDGKGIPFDHLPRIFEPFFTTRRGQGGSGLGLSIVYNLITGTLKGNIRADSKPGDGVHFHISLPATYTTHCA